MANYIVSDTELTSVANAIRTRGGTSESLAFPDGFNAAIEAISNTVEVESPTLDTLQVSSNGTYEISSGDYPNIDGWNTVEVDVSPSLGTLQVNSDGTYDISDGDYPGIDGWDRVEVDTSSSYAPSLTTLTPTGGNYYSYQSDGDPNYDGWGEVDTTNLLNFTVSSTATTMGDMIQFGDWLDSLGLGPSSRVGVLQYTANLGGDPMAGQCPVNIFYFYNSTAGAYDIQITGGIYDKSSGMSALLSFTLGAAFSGVSCDQAYLIQNGALTDLTSMASSVLSNFKLMLIY